MRVGISRCNATNKGILDFHRSSNTPICIEVYVARAHKNIKNMYKYHRNRF